MYLFSLLNLAALKPHKKFIVASVLLLFVALISYFIYNFAQSPSAEVMTSATMPWWIWPISLFVVSFLIGVIAVLGGIGGGTLYVPLVSSFFPFHIDFIRAAGLLVALSGAVAASPKLLKKGMADLRFAMPIALIASISSIIGALIGLALPSNLIQIMLGASILAIVVIMLLAKKSEFPDVNEADPLSTALRIHGIYYSETKQSYVNWKIHRTKPGLILFIVIGLMAGMFGVGAGWANVPVLNLLMGAPLKVSVATSKFLLSITDTSAAWIYVTNGAVLPIIAVPSILGVMLGSRVGVRLITKVKAKQIKYLILIVLFYSGVRSLMKGFGY